MLRRVCKDSRSDMDLLEGPEILRVLTANAAMMPQ